MSTRGSIPSKRNNQDMLDSEHERTRAERTVKKQKRQDSEQERLDGEQQETGKRCALCGAVSRRGSTARKRNKQCCGSVPLTNGSGSGSLLFEVTLTSFFKEKKS